jgi:prefoldin subunit 5
MRKQKNKLLLLLLVCILSCRAYSQNKFKIVPVDTVNNQFTEVAIGGTDTLIVTKKDSIKAYLISGHFLNSYVNLIQLYKKKDSVRILLGNSIENAYELLLTEYKSITDSIRNNIEKSSGVIMSVQNAIQNSQIALTKAEVNIVNAQEDIRKTGNIINEAQTTIQSAIDDLKKVKKKGQGWLYTAAGVGGLLIGILISR